MMENQMMIFMCPGFRLINKKLKIIIVSLYQFQGQISK